MVAIFFLLAVCPTFLQAISFPGAAAYLGQDAIENFAQNYIPYAINTAQGLSELNYSLPLLLSSMDFEFTNINFHNFQILPNQIGITYDFHGSTITFAVGPIDLRVSANFTLHWFGKYTGWTSFNFTQATFTIPTAIGASKSKVTFEFSKMKIAYTDFHFKFHSNNVFLSLIGFTEYIYGVEALYNYIVINKLESMLKAQNGVISNFLDNWPYTEYVGDQGIAFDYSPIDVEVSHDNGVQFNLAGDAWIPKQKLTYSKKMNTYLPWNIQSDLRIQLTDYFFNSYLWALSSLGYLNYTFSQQNHPNFKVYFTTTGMELILPGIVATYGSDLPVFVTVSVLPDPTVNFYDSLAKLQGTLSIAFYVNKNGANDLALNFNVNMTTKLGLWFDAKDDGDYLNYEIYANATEFGTYVVTKSNIGNVDLSQLQGAINWGIQSLVMFINPKLAIYAIKLPLPQYVKLNSPQVLVMNRNVQIGGQVDFTFS